MSEPREDCQPEVIALYVEGELDPVTSARVETHLGVCPSCAAELQSQRQLIFHLGAALAEFPQPPVPQNFARLIAVRAESDLRGVRRTAEGKRALRFCVLLALASFSLLGFAAIKGLLFSGELWGRRILSVFALVGRTIYDAAVGLAVISRVFGSFLFPTNHLANIVALSGLVLAVVLLSFLIFGYRRYQDPRLFD